MKEESSGLENLWHWPTTSLPSTLPLSLCSLLPFPFHKEDRAEGGILPGKDGATFATSIRRSQKYTQREGETDRQLKKYTEKKVILAKVATYYYNTRTNNIFLSLFVFNLGALRLTAHYQYLSRKLTLLSLMLIIFQLGIPFLFKKSIGSTGSTGVLQQTN